MIDAKQKTDNLSMKKSSKKSFDSTEKMLEKCGNLKRNKSVFLLTSCFLNRGWKPKSHKKNLCKFHFMEILEIHFIFTRIIFQINLLHIFPIFPPNSFFIWVPLSWKVSFLLYGKIMFENTNKKHQISS